MSEIKVNSVVNSTGDNDSGLDLSTNDQVIIKTANTTAVTVDSSQGVACSADLTVDTSTLKVDSSNNRVGIGTASPSHVLHTSGTGQTAKFESSNNQYQVELNYSNSTSKAFIGSFSNGIVFAPSSASQAMQINSNGNVGIGQASTNSKLSVTEQGGDETIANFANNASSSPYGLSVDFASSAPDNNSNYAFRFEDSSTDRLIIYSDGDVYNHDGTYAQFSDRRIKDNITDANSQWEDIKAMRFVNYQRKDDILQYGAEDAKVQLGLIGQELEAISPNLVREVEPTANDIRHSSELGSLYEEGDEIPEGKQIGDVKEITDQVKGVAYSILYMKAVKALQEAMTRIETLETAKTDLEARITALENAE